MLLCCKSPVKRQINGFCTCILYFSKREFVSYVPVLVALASDLILALKTYLFTILDIAYYLIWDWIFFISSCHVNHNKHFDWRTTWSCRFIIFCPIPLHQLLGDLCWRYLLILKPVPSCKCTIQSSCLEVYCVWANMKVLVM